MLMYFSFPLIKAVRCFFFNFFQSYDLDGKGIYN